MVRAKSKRSMTRDFDRVDKVLVTGRIKRSDYVLFSNTLLSGNQISEAEREKLGRLFEHFRLGRVRLID